MASFDVVSNVEMHEVSNAVGQVIKEISTRYDFKGSKSKIELGEQIIITADDDMKLQAIQHILKERLARRKVSLKSIEFLEPQKAGGDMLRQEVNIKQCLSTEETKRINKLVKAQKMKVTVQIQGEQLRVTGKKRDDLQQVIQFLKSEVEDIELQFINFRD